MINDILKYIGDYIKTENDYFNKYDVNCLRDQDGHIIADFFTGLYEEDCNISDIPQVAFYIRNSGKINYDYSVKAYSSCERLVEITNGQRLVAYSVGSKRFDTFKIESKLRKDLNYLNFAAYTGTERNIKIQLKTCDLVTANIIRSEYKDKNVFGEEATVIAFDFDLIFISDCKEEGCNVFLTNL